MKLYPHVRTRELKSMCSLFFLCPSYSFTVEMLKSLLVSLSQPNQCMSAFIYLSSVVLCRVGKELFSKWSYFVTLSKPNRTRWPQLE